MIKGGDSLKELKDFWTLPKWDILRKNLSFQSLKRHCTSWPINLYITLLAKLYLHFQNRSTKYEIVCLGHTFPEIHPHTLERSCYKIYIAIAAVLKSSWCRMWLNMWFDFLWCTASGDTPCLETWHVVFPIHRNCSTRTVAIVRWCVENAAALFCQHNLQNPYPIWQHLLVHWRASPKKAYCL